MVFECKDQPKKGLYLAYQALSTLLVRLPLWAAWYLPPCTRPRPSWSWAHTLAVQMVRHVTYVTTVVGGIRPRPDWRAIAPTGGDAEGVWVPGAPDLITGDLKTFAHVSEVEPQSIPGYWYSTPGTTTTPRPPSTPADTDKVFYCLHGGGYIQLSAHPSDHTANITRSLVALGCAPRAFALEYRLSATHPYPDRFPFPAALLDAVAGYAYLVRDVGYRPQNIILVGDSAGGNLALALVRYLVESRQNGAPPGQLLLLSPWTDLSLRAAHNTGSSLSNTADYLGDPDTRRGLYSKEAYLAPYGLRFAAVNRYVSPVVAGARFCGFPRTFVTAGTAERFLDQIRALAGRMGADMGVGAEGVVLYEARDAVHDYLAFGWHPGRAGTLQAIKEWLR
ncbi:Alpha/Beta hydrolase protein [Hygrophoropsis aurantiaca]|uniref:Alpha/Beta hydrolase protein n=1 Tax=Hygrophoropsis aurantiaca TaxID=72124 RepID=A0ACB8A435_9AGAM|nr:Alpha/Beta hydrolase protein [Hygrophoropsis aurantiaca]